MKHTDNMKNNLIVLGTLPVLFIPLSSCNNAKPDKKSKQYNIIHIMTDDHAWQCISAYGHPISTVARTPNIDRLASQGMLFTNAYVENSISAPSRATLITGLYSHKHGQTTLSGGFNDECEVFPEILHDAGYQTALIGKWHLDAQPRGFDYYKVLDKQGEYYNPEFMSTDSDGKYIREEGYVTNLITDSAIGWLENRDPSKPFALMVHHKAPHRDFMPAPEYFGMYDDVTFPLPETFYDDYQTRGAAAHSQEMRIADYMTLRYDLKVDNIESEPNREQENWSKKGWEESYGRMTDAQKEAWQAYYGPRNRKFMEQNLSGDELAEWKYQNYLKDYMMCIASVDDQIGRLLDYLEENGLMENTLIVYTSDQGFYMGEHGWFDKRFMYEESFRTPVVAMCKGVIPAGTVCDELIQNIDFAPTYLDFGACAEKASDMDGASLKEIMKGHKPKNWRKDIYYHYYDYPSIHMVRWHDGVSDGRYKLIHFYGEGFKKDAGQNLDYYEFYDLEKDPDELNNQIDNPSFSTQIAKLKKRIEEYRENLGVTE